MTHRPDDLPPGSSVGIVLLMAILTLVGFGIASCANAQGYSGAYSIPPGAKRFEAHPATADCAARVSVVDREGMFNRDQAVTTPVGSVVIRYTTHGGQMHADTAEVMDMDAGLSVAPLFAELTPDAPVYFCIRKAKGGS